MMLEKIMDWFDFQIVGVLDGFGLDNDTYGNDLGLNIKHRLNNNQFNLLLNKMIMLNKKQQIIQN
jgi:hypothetical protein